MDTPHAIDHMYAYCAIVEDLRRQHPMTLHALGAIVIITILGTMCGAHNWVEIEQWSQARQAWRSEFLELPHGLPSHDTFGRVFALLDPEAPPQPSGKRGAVAAARTARTALPAFLLAFSSPLD